MGVVALAADNLQPSHQQSVSEIAGLHSSLANSPYKERWTYGIEVACHRQCSCPPRSFRAESFW